MTEMRFFEDANALDSLRHSDFDTNSAYGEVIDNSLQANAKNITIKMFCVPIRNNFEQIEHLAFADDGDGMSLETLHACLKLGWSSRFNDRSGIGRFGVGMILGAIHEVKKVEVYSKQQNGSWLYTYIDLDEIEAGDMEAIPEPIAQNVPNQFSDLIDNDKGTLVLWSKYDKQDGSGSAQTIAKSASHWIGRTFRKFIWDGVKIKLNNQIIYAHDPLYARTELTKFPNDPKAERFEPILLGWKDSEIKITMSLLPKEFRKYRGAGGSAEAKVRCIDENEGISILRNNREVFYGNIPYWSKVKMNESSQNTWSFEDRDRWWGCEIMFDAEIDSSFSVKNIKRGANPERDLKKLIKEMIAPTRGSCLEKVRLCWEEDDLRRSTKEQERDLNLGRGPHSKAEKIVKNTPTPRSKAGGDQTAEEAAKELAEKATLGQNEATRDAVEALFKEQPFTIVENSWQGQTFFEPQHAGGNSLLSYNLNHEYFKNIYTLMDNLERGIQEPKEIAADLRVLIDLLLISVAKAQALNDDDMAIEKVSDFVENLNNQWGMMLTNYTKNWVRTKNNQDGDQ